MKISATEFFGSQDLSGLTHEHYVNAIQLLHVLNLLRNELGVPMTVNSGYRSPAHNVKIGGSPKSSHCTCQAVDFADGNGALKKQMMANNNALLVKYNLYMEDPKDTVGWCHLSTRAPASGNRVFGK